MDPFTRKRVKCSVLHSFTSLYPHGLSSQPALYSQPLAGPPIAPSPSARPAPYWYPHKTLNFQGSMHGRCVLFISHLFLAMLLALCRLFRTLRTDAYVRVAPACTCARHQAHARTHIHACVCARHRLHSHTRTNPRVGSPPLPLALYEHAPTPPFLRTRMHTPTHLPLPLSCASKASTRAQVSPA